MEVYGIDFGTTNSATIGLDYEHVGAYGDDHGQPYPSILAIDKVTGKVTGSGRDVWEHREKLRSTCEIITSIKTYLGTDKTWIIGNKTWYPKDVAAEILKGLKQQVKKKSGGNELESAIISIPIGFDPLRRRELRLAAAEAGINVKNFVSEPSAAVYKHYSDVAKWQKIAVFDWGGGTLDIAVVELNDGTVVELSTLGLKLGGDDIDKKIAEWAHKKILKATNGDKSFQEMSSNARDSMMVEAESVKRKMSSAKQSSLLLFDYDNIDAPAITIDAEKFESLIDPELTEATDSLQEAISRAHLSVDELGCILMVGGSSKLRGLVDRLDLEFDCEIIEPDKNSDWHVAHGAALLNDKQGGYKISQNIGLVLSDDTYYPLIKKGQTLNHKKRTLSFGLVEDSPAAQFIFVESKNNSPNGFKVGRKTIGYLNVPTYGFLYEPITLTFHIDDNLLLTASAESGNMPNNSTSWEFDELRFSYALPVNKE